MSDREAGQSIGARQVFRKHLRRAGFVPLVLMLVFTVVLALVFDQLTRRARWVEHTQAVLAQANKCFHSAVELQTGLRGYQLTGSTNFLKPYLLAREAADAEWRRLETMVEDNPDQQARAAVLHQRVTDFVRFGDKAIAQQQAGVAPDVALHEEGDRRVEEIRTLFRAFVAQEERLLVTRTQTLSSANRALLAFRFTAALLIAAALAMFLRRQLRGLSGAYESALVQVQQSAETLSVTLRSIGDAVITTDGQARVTMLNPVAETLTGWKEEQARGKPIGEVFHLVAEEPGQEALNPVDRVLKEGRVVGLTNHTQLVHRNGTACAIADSAAPIRTREGAVIGSVLVFRDVSEERKAERALRASEARLATVLEHLGEGVVIATENGELMYWNSTALRIHGYTTLEECRRDVGEFTDTFELSTLDGKVLPIEQWPMPRILRGESVHDAELRLRRLDVGWEKIISYSGVMIQTASGERIAAVSTFDRTDQRAAEAAVKESERNYRELSEELERRVEERTSELTQANERLKEVDRLKSEFLATMSHELRTPLNSIIGFTEIISAGLVGPINEEQKRQLGMVLNSGRHLLQLINDLLDVARIESGKAEVSIQEFDLRDVVKQVTDTLNPIAAKKQITLRSSITGDTRIKSDRKMIFQVLLNLANNAVKFTERGEVSIEVDRSRGSLRLAVTDTGIGIQEENLRLLFEAFRQVDGSARRRFEGTGLGLYLSKRLVELLGGRIEVSSEFGKGSTFTVLLPIPEPTL